MKDAKQKVIRFFVEIKRRFPDNLIHLLEMKGCLAAGASFLFAQKGVGIVAKAILVEDEEIMTMDEEGLNEGLESLEQIIAASGCILAV